MNISLRQQLQESTAWPHLVGICLLIIPGIIAWHDFHRLESDVNRINIERQTLTSIVENEDAIRVRHTNTIAALREANEQANSWHTPSFDAMDDAAFLANVSRLADTQQLLIKNFSPGTTTNVGKDIQFSATGTFANICRFLDALEALPTLCEITNCALATNGQVADGCALDLRVRLLSHNHILQRVTRATN